MCCFELRQVEGARRAPSRQATAAHLRCKAATLGLAAVAAIDCVRASIGTEKEAARRTAAGRHTVALQRLEQQIGGFLPAGPDGADRARLHSRFASLPIHFIQCSLR